MHLIAMAGLGFASLAAAAQSTSPTPAEKHLIASGSRITQRFQSASGLTAVVADNGKDQRMFYLTPDGKSLIVGAIFGADGSNITGADMQRVASASTPAKPQDAAALMQRAEKLQWVADGNRGKVIYVVFDPNCMYCHGLYAQLRQAVAAGRVQVRWIPVAILANSSSSIAASIYGASDRGAALGQAFNHMLPDTTPSAAVTKALSYNVLFLRDTGYTGVPLVLYGSAGKPVMHKGAPSNAQELEAIIGS